VPTTIRKGIRDLIEATRVAEEPAPYLQGKKVDKMTAREKKKLMQSLEKEMKEAARQLDFEKAAEIRDILFELKGKGKKLVKQ